MVSYDFGECQMRERIIRRESFQGKNWLGSLRRDSYSGTLSPDLLSPVRGPLLLNICFLIDSRGCESGSWKGSTMCLLCLLCSRIASTGPRGLSWISYRLTAATLGLTCQRQRETCSYEDSDQLRQMKQRRG